MMTEELKLVGVGASYRRDLDAWVLYENNGDRIGQIDGDRRDVVDACLAALRPSTPPAMSDDLVEVTEVETVSGDFLTEPGDPFWRISVGGFCADFEHKAAAENFADAVNLLIHRREQQAAEAVWRPIDTAPRDGTPFIAALTVRNIRTGRSWQQTDVIWTDDETDEIANECESGWSRVSDYEWWMPVPPIRSLTTEVGEGKGAQ